MSSSRSRTAPPTTLAEWPASRSTSQTLSAAWLSATRRSGCRARGTRCGACAGNPRTRRMKRWIIEAAILAQRDHRPAAPRRIGGERRVGVDGDGVAHTREQRQVVVRVAVEAAVREVLEAPAEAREPLVDAPQLALAEARRAGEPPGEAPGDALGLGGDEVRHAELARDRRGDEAVGGGDDGTQLARGKVSRH